MRVAVDFQLLAVGSHYITRGIPRYTRRQLREVLALDAESEYVVAVAPQADVNLIDDEILNAPNVSVEVAPEVSGIDPYDVRLLRWTEEYQRWLEKQQVDVFHIAAPYTLGVRTFPHFDVCPMVATVYDVIPLVFPDHYIERRVESPWLRSFSLLRSATRLIAISKAARDGVHLYTGYPLNRIDVAYPAPDEVFAPMTPPQVRSSLARLRSTVPLPERYALTVTSPTYPSKNLGTLLRAYTMLPEVIRRDLPLVITCHLSEREQWGLAEDLLRLDLASDVVTTGLVSDSELAALYNGAAMLIYPSWYEGFGLPVVEAMACGTPVITTTATSLPEIAEEAGILVDPLDARELARAIETCASDPELREVLQVRGLERASAFSGHRLGQATLEAYQRALASVEPRDQRRIALWTSDLPPAGSERPTPPLLGALSRVGEVEVFVDDDFLPSAQILSSHRIYHHSAFPRRQRQSPFDVVLYHRRNGAADQYMTEPMRQWPGRDVREDADWRNVVSTIERAK
jgi:glycosyltransferase involved in cell wall biosynthesis